MYKTKEGHFILFKFLKFCPTRPEGAEALSPGQRPGLFGREPVAL